MLQLRIATEKASGRGSMCGREEVWIGEGLISKIPRPAGALRGIHWERHDAPARRSHTRNNLHFRIVAVLNQPVGGDKYEVDMGCLHSFRKGLSVFFWTPTSKPRSTCCEQAPIFFSLLRCSASFLQRRPVLRFARSSHPESLSRAYGRHGAIQGKCLQRFLIAPFNGCFHQQLFRGELLL